MGAAMIGPREIRPTKCDALGIHKIDPSAGCPFATATCRKSCYAMNAVRRWLSACHRGTHTLMLRIALDGKLWSRWTARHFKGIKFIRLGTRFEPLKSACDVERIRKWALESPGTTFQIPTRCWHDAGMRRLVEERLMGLPNIRLLASIDKETTQEEFEGLRADGWSTMGFWSRKEIGPHPLAGDMPSVERCPKTWEGAHGKTACLRCAENDRGCFGRHRKDIYLKLHS